ncbi:hypothetical protein BX600DRAFT_553974 [Xylariales sp. PMI_506]|nr:hypothetical protein BX600DRAFT_553974 [Xylariales sp. PMI_506]
MVSSLITLTSLLAATAMALPGPNGALPKRNVTADTLTWDTLQQAMAVDPSTFQSYKVGGLVREPRHTNETSALTKRACATTPAYSWGDTDEGGPGILIGNAGTDYRWFYFYENGCNTVAYQYTLVPPGYFVYYALPSLFAGRITRGTNEYDLYGQADPATWFEFSLDENNWIWGDISLIRGCDGPAVLYATDGSGSWKGWNSDIISDAPAGATTYKADGSLVIQATEGENAVINTIPDEWDLAQVGPDYVYCDDSHGAPVIASTNGRFGVGFPDGNP